MASTFNCNEVIKQQGAQGGNEYTNVNINEVIRQQGLQGGKKSKYYETFENVPTIKGFKKPKVKINTTQLNFDEPYLKDLKPTVAFDEDVLDNIALISATKYPKIFGSYSYRASYFSGDIDLIEPVYLCCSRKEAINKFAKTIQHIIKKIMNSPDGFLGDVKLGLDPRYMINIGFYRNDKLIDYNVNNVRNSLYQLFKKKLLDKNNYYQLLKYAKKNIKVKDYQNLYNGLRDHFILRWNENELIDGYKILPGKVRMTIQQALEFKTYVKIDMWAFINNEYVELTDFYILYQFNKKSDLPKEGLKFVETAKLKKANIINLDQNFANNFINTLKEDIETLFNEHKYDKVFKLCKRMWTLFRSTDNLKDLKLLTPLLQSDGGRFYKIASQADTILLMLKKIKNLDVILFKRKDKDFKYSKTKVEEFEGKSYFSNISLFDILMDQIRNFKHILSNITQVYYNEDEFYYLIDQISKIDYNFDFDKEKELHYKNTNEKRNDIIKLLDKIKHFASDQANNFAIQYLRKIKFFPPPRYVFPTVLKHKIKG